MLILVTRPEPQASEWVTRLQALGEQAVALPLIDIGPPARPDEVRAAWQALPEVRLVMFVSPNAALWFARQRPPGTPWPAGTLAAAPGPGTAQTVLEHLGDAGLGAQQVLTPPPYSAQFDSEHLWPVLAPLAWGGQTVLIISGGDQTEVRGRAWLSNQLTAAGAQVRPVLTYQRQCARWSPAQHQQALAALRTPEDHLWLLSSSEAVTHLTALTGPVPAGARALVTHPRVAQAARAAGFGLVREAQPTPESVAHARRCWDAPAG